jgi:hypothetical protein
MLRLSRFGLILCSVSLLGAATNAPAVRQADTVMARLPLRFEANQGQLSPEVRYTAHAGAYNLQLTNAGPSLTLGSHRVDISLLDSNRAPQIDALDPQATRTDYYVGKRDGWRANVASFGRVRYQSVYPGIDIVYYGNRSQLEYDFVIAPGADPRAIRMCFRGAKQVRIGEAGDLMVDDMIQKRPVIYQDNPRREVTGRYVLLGRNTVGVRVGGYDRSRALVIDPVLTYLTYMGGTGADRINAAKLFGNKLYIAGQTATGDLGATDGAYASVNNGGVDIFVAIVDTTPGAGYRLLYFSYLGGSGDDIPNAIDVDAKGVLYLTGSTNSTNFSLGGAVPQITGGGAFTDAFVLQLDPAGSGTDALTFSTYLGGATGDEVGNGIAIGNDAMIYVIGTTKSSDFPVTGNAYQPVQWGPSDAFVAKLDPVAGTVVYATYLGGEGQDDGRAILVGANGLVYFAASTVSDNFPMAGFQVYGSRLGAEDAIFGVMDLTKAGPPSLVYSTFFGGTGNEEARGMAFDAKGNVIVTGYTLSTDLPVTGDAVQSASGGNGDAFVAVFNPSLTFGQGLLYSTYFGGSHGEVGYEVAGDAAGNIYLAGYTLSADLTVAGTVPQSQWGKGTNVFVTSFKTGVSGKGALNFSTYMGSSGTYVPTGLALAADGTIYLVGYGSIGLPSSSNAQQGGFGSGATDGFILVMK